MRYSVGLALSMVTASPAAATVTYTLHTQTMYLDEYHIVGEYPEDVVYTISLPDFALSSGSVVDNPACVSHSADFDCGYASRITLHEPFEQLRGGDTIVLENYAYEYSVYIFDYGALSKPGTYETLSHSKSSDKATGSLTVSTSAVPEPASWAMMVAGFAVIGVASRRRRTVTA